ncbi:TPA: hypothetical protein N0F65_001989 [Lagenidium giganteum]|uniref:Uncharacterized protein n=1 Tax=Lagenidium giganteum TaxID=4803 RepID=A0AAV2Z105_9STRA|nr:TPA: hypothetical protein N0F65_001989 [Lagenidium giganteum]
MTLHKVLVVAACLVGLHVCVAAPVKTSGADGDALPAGIIMLGGPRDPLQLPSMASLRSGLTTDDDSGKVSIARSSITFAHDDRIDHTSQIQAIVLKGTDRDVDNMTRQILQVVRRSPTDTTIMAKINAVVASRSNPTALRTTIQDLLDAAAAPEGTKEEAVTGDTSLRVRFSYPYSDGTRYGWRYPLAYWRSSGAKLFGGNCDFAKVYGDYFYC